MTKTTPNSDRLDEILHRLLLFSHAYQEVNLEKRPLALVKAKFPDSLTSTEAKQALTQLLLEARIDELEKTLISGCWGKPMQQRENHIRKRKRELEEAGKKHR